MREILFRGKKLSCAEWVYGSLVICGNKYYIYVHRYGVAFEVIPETIGQYTGLKDKSGTKIFAGDIVKWRFERVWKTEYHISTIVWDYFMSGWRLTVQGGNAKMRKDIEYEILGNIHDNPELLEVK